MAKSAAGAGVLDHIGAGTLLLRADGAELDPTAPLATSVSIDVSGIVARVTVEQRFRNTTAGWVEALYAFPLPDGAAVDRLTMRIGERVIEGEIKERSEAEAVYREARDSGRRASLVSESTPNLFTTSVANIGPGEEIDVVIGYFETARYDAGELSLRFPMTLTPRYGAGESRYGAGESRGGRGESGNGAGASHVGGTQSPSALPAEAVAARRDFRATATSAASRAQVHVALDAGLPVAAITSRYDAIRTSANGTRYDVETVDPLLAMDHDFVLSWRPRVGSTPAVTALTETRADGTYALLMILPPTDTAAYVSEPRELIFVVDTSGSMGGQSLEQAKLALADGLRRLGGADRFNVFQFNSTTSSLFQAPVPLTPSTYSQAMSYVEGLRADGGTEMATAIGASLDQPATPGYLRQVVFLTDGGVANETELFTLIKRHLGGARLFTIGIGAAPNSYFMRKAAAFGRGSYTHVGAVAEVESAMTALFDKIQHVALADVAVDWPAASEFYPQRVPDLYAGEPIVIAGRLDGPLPDALSLELFARSAGVPWSRSVTIRPGDANGIAELWARRKIESLLDARVDGYADSLIRRLVVEVALEYGLVSPYTSLVATEKTAARPGGENVERRVVPNMAPAGALYAGFPQTATDAELYRRLGIVLLAAAFAVLWLRREGLR
jgi:Ca-activated chloride channel family protein